MKQLAVQHDREQIDITNRLTVSFEQALQQKENEINSWKIQLAVCVHQLIRAPANITKKGNGKKSKQIKRGK